MTLIFDNGSKDQEAKEAAEEDLDFHAMSSDEFFDDLVQEVASEMNISIDELEEMDLEDINEELDTKVKKPYHPRGAREGYRDSDRLKTVGKKELEHRKKVVEERLGL